MTVPTVPAGVLGRADALVLGHALVWEMSRRLSVRTLVIKGVSGVHYGFRPEYLASDIDVLLESRDLAAEFVDLLQTAGWQLRHVPVEGLVGDRHSVTLWHSAWPIDIDVHHRFPGFLKDPAASFDALWSSREVIDVESFPIAIPGKYEAILLGVLHGMRGNSRQPRHGREIDALREWFVVQELSVDKIAEAARATGSDATAAAFLGSLGVPATRLVLGDDDELRRWESLTRAGATPVEVLLHELGALPLRTRIARLPRLLWPPAADFDPVSRDLKPCGVAHLRLVRIAHAVPVLAQRAWRTRPRLRGRWREPEGRLPRRATGSRQESQREASP